MKYHSTKVGNGSTPDLIKCPFVFFLRKPLTLKPRSPYAGYRLLLINQRLLLFYLIVCLRSTSGVRPPPPLPPRTQMLHRWYEGQELSALNV